MPIIDVEFEVPPRFDAQGYLVKDLATRRWTAGNFAALDTDWPGINEHTTDTLMKQALEIARSSARPAQVRAWLRALYATPAAVTSLMFKDGYDLLLHRQAQQLIKQQPALPESFTMHTGPDLVWALHHSACDDHDRALLAFAAGLSPEEIAGGADRDNPGGLLALAAFNRPDLSALLSPAKASA